MRLVDRQLGALLTLALALLVTGGSVSSSFLSTFNLQSMGGQVPEIALLAIGLSLAMCVGNGGIDLSGIALANMSGVSAALIAHSLLTASTNPDSFTILFIFLSILVGLVGGLLNGLIIVYARVTPILCTLGTQMLFTGLAVVISDGRSVTVGAPRILSELGNGLVMGLPISFLLFLIIAAAIGAVLSFTPFGLRLMLNGTNPVAATFAGFNQKRIVILTYTASGILAGFAAVIIAARNINVKWDYGTSYLLIAILIAVMAGVRPEGGYGRILNVVLSAIVLQLMSSILNFIGLSNFVRDFAWGLLLLCFLAFGRFGLADMLALYGRRAKPATDE
jgi:simple sugar transport system permease protein